MTDVNYDEDFSSLLNASVKYNKNQFFDKRGILQENSLWIKEAHIILHVGNTWLFAFIPLNIYLITPNLIHFSLYRDRTTIA